MSERFLTYLKREHSRLDEELRIALKSRFPDEVLCARLKKLKPAIKDQIEEAERLTSFADAA